MEVAVEDRMNPDAFEEGATHSEPVPQPRGLRLIEATNSLILRAGQFLAGALVSLAVVLSTGFGREIAGLIAFGGGLGTNFLLGHLPHQRRRQQRKGWAKRLAATLSRKRWLFSARGLRIEGTTWAVEFSWSEVGPVWVDRLGMTAKCGGYPYTLSFHEAFTREDAIGLAAQIEEWRTRGTPFYASGAAGLAPSA